MTNNVFTLYENKEKLQTTLATSLRVVSDGLDHLKDHTIKGCAIALVLDNNEVVHYHTSDDNVFALVGAVEVLKTRLLENVLNDE